ncbi:MAG: sigma-70 family RNA polymerase sigma factor [Armatimonadota bacterium]|nr:MAG: RNA polymerase sigma factor [Armatimonadota bacterium]
MRAEERALIERCRQHDLEAFDELVRLYERRIFNFALRLSGNHHDAEDITVETFIRVFNAIANFRGDATFSTWLFRIAHNVFLDMRKKERAHPHTSLQDVLELDESEVTRQVEDPAPLPERMAEDAELSQILRRAIDELPDYQKTMVLLYHTQNKSYEEIAEIMHLPIGTVKSRLNRARIALKSKLEPLRELFER